MRDLKMAELKFEAPLATFESEEWNDFNDFQTANDLDNVNTESVAQRTIEKTDNMNGTENFGETLSASLEDLVNTLDDKITKCFCNYEDKVEKFAPVQIRTQEEIMNDCQMWWTITGNFGNLLPIDWSKTYTRQLHTKALHLREKPDIDSDNNLDLSDDEELAQAFDMHSLMFASHQIDDEDHIITADQVISEIEHMMQDSDKEVDIALEEVPEPVPAYVSVKERLQHLPQHTEKELKEMPAGALNDFFTEYEKTVKDLSETLVHELALRDELEYDKELKNQFISLLLTIQKKRRENNLDRKRNKKNKTVMSMMMMQNNINNSGSSLGMASGATSPETATSYLTTVIPYYPQMGPPASEQLQIYIKLLQAINEDSQAVPALLTDYILKVLCPT